MFTLLIEALLFDLSLSYMFLSQLVVVLFQDFSKILGNSINLEISIFKGPETTESSHQSERRVKISRFR